MAYQDHIDWMWDNNGPPTKVECLAFVVQEVPPVLRGNASAHECVVNAIRATRGQQAGGALEWLKAGQCHNDGARNEIGDAGQAAVDYAVNKYGAQVG